MISDGIIGFFVPVVTTFLSVLPSAGAPMDMSSGAQIMGSSMELVVALDRLVPITEMLRVFLLVFIVQNAYALLWLLGWVYGRIPFKAT